MKLGRSFFSLYFLVISIFIVFSWMLDEAWNSYLEQDIESYTGYESMLSALAGYAKKHPQQEWYSIIEGAGAEWSLPLSLVPIEQLHDLAHQENQSISEKNTHIYYDNDAVFIHHRIEGSALVIILGPAKMPTRPRVIALVRVILMASLGCMLFLWLRPISRDLDRLRRTASALGQGHFDVIAPKAKSTMMDPLVIAFNTMAQRIKRLIDAHKELSNAVAHELRTPLARSKFALQMLANTDDQAKREKYQSLICQDINELEELINEMLIYASFDNETPNLKFSTESLGDLVHAQLSNYQQYQHKFTVVDNLGKKGVDVDKHFICRALNNYLSNAIKYGKDEITIILEQVDEQCQIRVEDNGEGVCDSFKKTIFDAFSRGDISRNKATGGFGLGLAIVCRVMEWHHGYASIENGKHGGACFMLTWPMKRNLV